LPISLQAKLLRAIQGGTIERLGSSNSIAVDFRLIAATAQDLTKAVEGGHFREDRYYRLNVVRMQLPPFRERIEDVPLLVQRILGRSERPATLREDALQLIMSHEWPGNL